MTDIQRSKEESNICYCGNYGGGVHTRSARCPGGEAGARSSKTNDDHTRWLTETWQMIERCAASLNPMECVKLTTAGCAALIQERLSVETPATPDPISDGNRELVAEVAMRRGITLGHLREDGGCELAQIMRRLDAAEERLQSETPAAPKRAYYETHDAPHCPSCSCGMSPWRSMESAPRSGVVLWLITPKAEDEAYTDTSGRPITGKFAPYVHLGPYGCWSALSKAVGWCPVPAPHMPPSKASAHTLGGFTQDPQD